MGNETQKISQKNVRMRILGAGLLIFCLFFGMQMKSGYCFGVEVFRSLGLSPWSGNGQGLFYPGILGILGAIGSMVLFSFGTKNRMRSFRYFMEGALGLMVLCWGLALIGVV